MLMSAVSVLEKNADSSTSTNAAPNRKGRDGSSKV
jgi:hypothetical protein